MREILAKNYSAKNYWFCQGPEISFSAGRYWNFQEAYFKTAKNIIITCDYLKNYCTAHGYLGNFININLGPSDLFYDMNIDRHENSILIPYRSNIEKGPGESIEAALRFSSMGMKVGIFGIDESDLDFSNLKKYNVTVYKKLAHNELNELFNKYQFLVDYSHIEGLGLIPLEAFKAGMNPIVRVDTGCFKILNDHGFKSLEDHITFGFKNLKYQKIKLKNSFPSLEKANSTFISEMNL